VEDDPELGEPPFFRMRSAGSNRHASGRDAGAKKHPAFVQRALEILRKCSTFTTGDTEKSHPRSRRTSFIPEKKLADLFISLLTR